MAVVIAQLARVGTGLVDDDDCVQSAAAGVQLADQGTARHNHSQHSTLKTAVHKIEHLGRTVRSSRLAQGLNIISPNFVLRTKRKGPVMDRPLIAVFQVKYRPSDSLTAPRESQCSHAQSDEPHAGRFRNHRDL